jgi:hypothetical protein
LVIKILANPSYHWENSNLNGKQTLLKLTLEEPLQMSGTKLGTPDFCLGYKLLTKKYKNKAEMVEPRGIEPLTSTLPVLRSPS